MRFRVTALAALLALGVLAAASAGLVVAQRQLLTRDLELALHQRADDLAGLVAAGQLPPAPAAAGDETAVQVVAADGAVVAASPNLAGESRPIADPPTGTGPTEVVRTADRLPVEDDRFRVLSRRIGTGAGALVIHVAASVDDIHESVAALRTSLAVAVPAVAALLAVMTWWLVGRTLRPVEAMRAEVADISGSDLRRRVAEPRTDDEIARLARTLNRMLDRLEDAADRQARFVADASHELRSPLARIRSEIEVDLAHPDRADLAATHRSVLEETDGLARLVDDLLALARGDALRTAHRGGDVDLDDIVLRQARRVRQVDGLRADTSMVSAAQVRGDADQLERAVANLVENATRHASGAVTFTLTERDGHAELAIGDDGPGIPPDQRDRVFERFARLDDARHRATGGTGLGLAIARDIARRHGGDIHVDPDHHPGARLVLRLPLPPAAARGGGDG